MQKLFYLLLLLAVTISAFAQVHDRSIGFGFHTQPEFIRYAGNGHWMVAGHGSVEPGVLFTDTVFVLLLDQSGNTLKSIRVNVPPSEVHYVYDAVPLPDGGFALSIASTLCDVVNDINSLHVLNADGSERWTLQTNGLGQPLPQHLAVTPDGNLFGVAGCFFQKYNVATGALLWQSASWNSSGNCYTSDVVLEPGTENVLILSGLTAKYLIKPPGSGTPVYELGQTFNINPQLHNITAAPNGWYYLTSDYDETSVVRIQLNGTQETFSFPTSYWKSMSAGADGLYWLGRQDHKTRILKTDWTLQTLQDLIIPDPYLFGVGINVQGDTVVLAGVDGSAQGYDPEEPGSDYYPFYKGRSLWFHSYWGAAVPSASQNNVTALELQQTGQLQIDNLGSPGNPYYKISGGNFRVRVKNSGNVPIKQLYVNTIFNTLYFICFYTPARRKFFDNLDIQPGAEQWLEFGALTDVYQYDLPEDICFWTSSPNGVPDLNHDDDFNCMQLIVSTQEAQESSLQFFPNPTSDGTLIKAADQTTLTGIYRVYDATGRVILIGDVSKGETQFFLPTGTFPAGLYWLKIGNRVGKLMVTR